MTVPMPVSDPDLPPAKGETSGTGPSEASGPGPSEPVPLGVKAQILATEHWSLLAARSMTWSEVMSRITIHLTISSASLVVLALFAQASGFGSTFRMMAIGLAAAVLVMGTLTQVRVVNASIDDASTILGMNRLRAAYLELDPTLAPYFVASAHDDQQGLMDTYLMGWPRSTLSHVAASTSIFLSVVNAMVAGTLGALVTDATDAPGVAVAVVGVVAGLLYFGVQILVGQRSFGTIRQTARFPTPEAD